MRIVSISVIATAALLFAPMAAATAGTGSSLDSGSSNLLTPGAGHGVDSGSGLGDLVGDLWSSLFNFGDPISHM
ncbi:hypothetical protein OHB26_16550 [Nocardia sp. NBC_01503]|uniref:hypothetical protein n=1 Tax=Nocardia sp. NBC_01503 TaxID=2975997 RepID=UPI002E7BC985|nr:hypothetical protein [Nocardia sp. NBC_01503]WTL35660.1 hypothetical protein OHB26_16550 [Nocardia sp. NBC_01503]